VPKGFHNLGPFERPIKTFSAFTANDRNIGHNFWIFHGINYLSGNPFAGIYQGDQIYRGTIFTHIMGAYMVGNVLSHQGQKCLVWAGTRPQELFRASLYIKAFVRKYKRHPLMPDDPYIKIAVEATAELMVAGTKNWGQTEPPVVTDYFRNRRHYDREMSNAARNVLAHDPRTRYGWAFWSNLHRQTIATLGLPPGVKPFRLDYVERKDRGHLKQYTMRMEDRPKKP